MNLFGDDLEVCRATIGRIKFQREDYIIAQVDPSPLHLKRDGSKFPARLSVKGSLPDAAEGQLYEFHGKISFDPKYKSHTLAFETYRTIMPDDNAGIMEYLCNVARWVGPQTAKQLVDCFGTDTLNVIKNEPAKVAEKKIKGITPDRLKEMQETLLDNAGMETATLEVANMLAGAVSPAVCRKAIRKWRSTTAAKIRENPFVLMEIRGVGFLTADAVHKNMGGTMNDPRRQRAGLQAAMESAAFEHGHTRLSDDLAAIYCKKTIGNLPQETVADAIESGIVKLFKGGIDTMALSSIADAEGYIARRVAMFTRRTGHEHEGAAEIVVDTSDLADDQIAAVELWKKSPIMVLTGAPGTGKTYTLARIISSAAKAGMNVRLCAPTGKAAKQMTNALEQFGPFVASTIHSILGPMVDEDTGEFKFSAGENSPIDCDFLVIDESSMIDVLLGNSLFQAIPPRASVLIVGDHYQLPSIGPGAFLRDCINAGVPCCELKKIKRNAGRIVLACHDIKDGRIPQPSPRVDLDGLENWRHLESSDPGQIVDIVRQLITEKLPAFGFKDQWAWQIISPTNTSGALSCDTFNTLAKGVVNPGESRYKFINFTEGDKVVRLRNAVVKGELWTDKKEDEAYRSDDNRVRIVNGDIGIVESIDDKNIVVKFFSPGRIVTLPRENHELRLAYCMTCHKMQGSESPVVILPIDKSTARLPMVSREWLYTAMSRAKKLAVTVGELSAIEPMIARVGNTLRSTGLCSELREWFNPKPTGIDI